jgi:hypothetical protein
MRQISDEYKSQAVINIGEGDQTVTDSHGQGFRGKWQSCIFSHM